MTITPPIATRISTLLNDYIIYIGDSVGGNRWVLAAVIIDPSKYRNNDSVRVEYVILPTEVSPIIELFADYAPIFGLELMQYWQLFPNIGTF